MTYFTFLVICGVILAIFFATKLYLKLTSAWCRSHTCLVGKTAIVTGANTGIGYETALDFAKRGAKVILACRDQQKAENASAKIITETGYKNIIVKIVNLASFDSVRAFAKDINETQDRLDILVNNAGAGGIGDKKSDDGNALLMQINYFSGFLLTNLLIGLLKKSAPSRVINVSSMAAKYADFDINQLNQFTGFYSTYASSKLCNIWFTRELAKKLEGTGVTTYSVHPGAVKTEIFRRLHGKYTFIFEFVKNHFFKTSEEGAQTTIYTSVARGIEQYNGEHFDECQRIPPYKTVDCPGLPEKLWKKTENLVQLKPEEIQYRTNNEFIVSK